MARRLPMLLGLALTLVGCSGGKSALLLRITAVPALRGVDSVEVTIGGVTRRYPASPPIDLVDAPPRTLVAVLPERLFGVVPVEVRVAMADGGGGAGSAQATITPGEESSVDVVLRPAPAADLGAPVDLAMPDLAMPDLAMPDLAMPDLSAVVDLAPRDLVIPVDRAAPDLATPPDLAIKDLAMKDLAVKDLAVPPDLARPPDLVTVVDMAGGCLMGCNNGLLCCAAVCTNTATSTDHCGKCGNKCPVPVNAASACAKGVCGFACNAGFANCDGNINNGCEQDIASDINHCGGCNAACPRSDANTTECVAGVCVFQPCRLGQLNCDLDPGNGCEVKPDSDRQNCGKCGNACPLPFGCFAGVCQ